MQFSNVQISNGRLSSNNLTEESTEELVNGSPEGLLGHFVG